MIDEQELLNAIWSSPHDDALRLIYADYLQDKGDEISNARAVFVRVQCQLASDTAVSEDRRGELESIELDLWKRFGRQFQKGLTGKLLNEPFHRGFVAPRRRGIAIEHFLSWPVEKMNQAPLWEFRFHSATDARLHELAKHARVERLGMIGLSRYGDDHAIAIAESPHARNLSIFDCSYWGLTLRGLNAIVNSTCMPNLTTLMIGYPRIDSSFVNMVIDSPLTTRLRQLDLTNCHRFDIPALGKLEAVFGDRLKVPREYQGPYRW